MKHTMSGSKNSLLTFFGGCTSFLWRYVWINYITIALLGRSFPFPWAVLFFTLSFLITLFTFDRGRRVIVIGVSHLFGFSPAVFGTLHSLYHIQTGILHPIWIGRFFSRPREPLEWLILFLVMAMPVLFWAGGVLLAKKRARYTSHCARLDIGITFFFLLFLMKFLLRTQGGIIIPEDLSIRLFYPFLVFGLAGVALSKNKGIVEKEFLSHHKGTGLVLTFTALLLVCITGLSLLLMPLMNTAAEAGYDIMTHISKPIGGLLVRILRFLFQGSRARSSVGASGEMGENTAIPLSEDDAAGGLLERILCYFLMGTVAAVVIGSVVLLVWFFVRKILSRTKVTGDKEKQFTLSDFFVLLKARLIQLIAVLSTFFHRLLRRYSGIEDIYLSFLRWGRRGGMERRKNETPEEYRFRLSAVYPFLENEINSISESFILAYYGPAESGNLNLDNAGREAVALRRLKSARFFFPRVKVWLKR